MGISALKTVLRNIENLHRSWRKPIEKQKFTHYVFCQYLETYTIFLKMNFWVKLVFILEIKFNWYKTLVKVFFFQINFYFFAWFFNGFSPISSRVSNISWNGVQRVKFTLKTTEYYSNNAVPFLRFDDFCLIILQ